jgi:hypothetical protein
VESRMIRVDSLLQMFFECTLATGYTPPPPLCTILIFTHGLTHSGPLTYTLGFLFRLLRHWPTGMISTLAPFCIRHSCNTPPLLSSSLSPSWRARKLLLEGLHILPGGQGFRQRQPFDEHLHDRLYSMSHQTTLQHLLRNLQR